MSLDETPHFLDNPPPFHSRLLEYGARPYWSADGKRIAFVDKAFGDVSEMDFETRQVRQLTHNLGEHHSFLRVLFLASGDYLLIGPAEYKDDKTSRGVESELWVMDKHAKSPPYRLGRRLFEGCGVSAIANRITYTMNGNHNPKLDGVMEHECHVTEIEYGADGRARLGDDRVIYRAIGDVRPEPQDFRHDDSEVIMAEYINMHSGRDGRTPPGDWKCVVKGVKLETGEVVTYIDENQVHNECEGIFPDHEHICLESSGDVENQYPPIDLWKLKLDGSGRRVRMTQAFHHAPWRTSNSNVSPDGRWLAFMTNQRTDVSGTTRGLGLLDLAAWEASPAATQWEYPHSAR